MGRVTVDVPTPALALRRAQAAAALGVSVEVFDAEVRPHLPVIRLRGVVTYPVSGLQDWLTENAERPMADQIARRAA